MNIDWSEFLNNTTAYCISVALVVLTAIYHYFKNRNVPPGPTGVPYFGYWPFLKLTTCHLQLQELGRRYGDVFSFTATGHLYINVGSFKSNREVFISKSECFSERIKEFTLANRLFRGSLITIDGEAWKTNKKFFSQQFKERGISSIKGQMCGPIYDAVQDTIADLRKTQGSPTDIIDLLMAKCTKILFQTCFGESGITEQEIKDLIVAYENIVGSLNGPSLLPCGTFAKYFIFPFMKSFQNILKSVKYMEDTLSKIIKRSKATFDEQHIRNILDAYHKEKLERLSKKDPSAQYFTDFILVGSLVQFIGDGVLAVAAFVGAFVYSLIEHPDDQERMYQELIEVIGTQRDPTMEDKSKLSYTNAFISEIIRTSDAFPFFPKLQCTKEVTIGGYRIPKGANMLVNIWNAHRDPDVYEDPEKFNPSRFLTQDVRKRPEQPMIFGMGKHSCMGENFTMVQVFLFMTTILKHFRLRAPENSNESSFLFFHGKMFICAQSRNE